MKDGYMRTALRHLGLVLAGGIMALAHVELLAADNSTGEELINEQCLDCHKRQPDGSLRRLTDARRTPEGWDMTVGRMTQVHRIKLSPVERQTLVKYLADKYGLAPEEAGPWRYAIERRPEEVDFIEQPLVGEICARCHSYARIGLQRRSETEWRRLANFHIGQFTTTELQSNNRAVNWWEIASQQIPPLLAQHYPSDSATWKAWQQQAKMNPAGSWRVTGHRPGWGDYEGIATISAKEADNYAVTLELNYANGKTERGSGEAIVYTGFEWRGSVKLGDEEVRQVFTLSDGGTRLQGRWFLTRSDVIGADLRAAKIDGPAEVMAVTPGFVKAGKAAQVTIQGVGLAGAISIDGGVTVTRIVARSAEKIVVEVQAPKGSAAGLHSVRVGDVIGARMLAVYNKIDQVRIRPDPGLSRVGDNGGKLAAIPIQFEAVAYASGKDGKIGTADDVAIGVMPARWSIDDLNPAAVAMRDKQFAGKIDAVGGLFMPGAAGPNKKRKFGTNNFGELKVIAEVEDGQRKVKGTGKFIVTAQRWNDPPIR